MLWEFLCSYVLINASNDKCIAFIFEIVFYISLHLSLSRTRVCTFKTSIEKLGQQYLLESFFKRVEVSIDEKM